MDKSNSLPCLTLFSLLSVSSIYPWKSWKLKAADREDWLTRLMRMVFLMAVLHRYNSAQLFGPNYALLECWGYPAPSQCDHLSKIATAIGWRSLRLLLAGPTSSSSLIATVGLPGQHSSASLIGGNIFLSNCEHLSPHSTHHLYNISYQLTVDVGRLK